jgi:glycerate 2-kinase
MTEHHDSASGRPREIIELALRALPDALDSHRRTIRELQRLPLDGTVAIVAIGKAARPMTEAALEVLGDRVLAGVVVTPDATPLGGLEVHVGSHPIPDDASEEAGRAALRIAGESGHEHLLVLVSGGGSAMAEVPKRPLKIADLGALTDRLLRAGTPIDEMNLVRRHLSDLKNGGLSGRSRVPVTTLVISDVSDGPPSMVASGPTLHDDSDPLEALAIVERRLGRPVPRAVHTALATPGPRRRNETAIVVADRHTAYAEVSHRLARSGLVPSRPVRLEGDAAQMARKMVGMSGLTVGTGETTVVVTGDGTGGRNQHGALAAAIEIAGQPSVFGTLGTDGVDGPTDAAGAIVDGSTLDALVRAGVDGQDALARCDSHHALDAVGSLIRTGPTGTNVADVWVSYIPATT